MGHFSASALDNYITGHYGEDQWASGWADDNENGRRQAAFAQGVQAHVGGKGLDDNPFLSKLYRAEWAKGWSDEDMSIQSSLTVDYILGADQTTWNGELILDHPLFGEEAPYAQI